VHISRSQRSVSAVYENVDNTTASSPYSRQLSSLNGHVVRGGEGGARRTGSRSAAQREYPGCWHLHRSSAPRRLRLHFVAARMRNRSPAASQRSLKTPIHWPSANPPNACALSRDHYTGPFRITLTTSANHHSFTPHFKHASDTSCHRLLVYCTPIINRVFFHLFRSIVRSAIATISAHNEQDRKALMEHQ